MRKNWLWYQTFRFPIVKFGLHIFYKKIILSNRDKLPKNKPILFVPNHQNSFMDALLVVTHTKPFIYFLTRAKAFEPKVQSFLLYSWNMLPVYRVRDGFSSIQKNNAIFDQCIQYMERNDAILIFPEASHDHKRRIRPLSKGFTRIAFDAELRKDWNMDLYVVPVGMNYSEHLNSRNSVHVAFGDPIKMSKYREQYEQDEREAVTALKEDVAEQLTRLTMHVPNLDHYPLHHIVLDDLEFDRSNLIDPDIANANVARIEEKMTPEILETGRKVYETSKEFGIKVKTVLGQKKSLLFYLLLPLSLFSWLNNLIPYQPIRKLIADVIKDHVFDVSIKFLIALFFFPGFWMLVSFILWLAGVPKEWIWGYLGVSILTVPLFKQFNLMIRESKEKKQLQAFKASRPEEYDTFVSGIKKLNEFRKEVLQ